MKKNLLNLLLCVVLLNCCKFNNCATDVTIGESYNGKGYLLFFRTSQDGRGDFWFFPACLDDSQFKSRNSDSLFLNTHYNTGVSFKLPLSSAKYAQIKNNLQYAKLDSLSFFSEVWYTPINISFERIKKTSLLFPNSSEKFQLIRYNHVKTFSYFSVDEITITILEIPH